MQAPETNPMGEDIKGASPLYLLRHAQTTWNVDKRIQGHKDSPLTLLGERQARAMGETLSALITEPRELRVVASPLGRTAQTASIVCGILGIAPSKIQFDDRLKEMSWGAFDGLTRQEMQLRDTTFFARRNADHWNFVPPGGESYAMAALRLGAWLAEQQGDRTLLIVTHGVASRLLRGLYLGMSRQLILKEDEPQDAIFRLQAGTATRIAINIAG